MASDHLRTFDPLHLLLKTEYGRDANHYCDICLSKLAGLVGHRCSACNIDVHDACASYFKKTISFFAHPWHTLTLSRMPATGSATWSCDLCKERCPTGSFVYRCIPCDFDVHPICTMLPQMIRSPLHQKHNLHMVPSDGSCSGCHQSLQVWHYRCGFCLFKLHIACVSGAVSGSAAAARGSDTAASGSAAAAQGSATAASQTNGSGQSVVVRPSRSNAVAKFLIKTSFRMAIDAATGGLASPVLDVLTEAC